MTVTVIMCVLYVLYTFRRCYCPCLDIRLVLGHFARDHAVGGEYDVESAQISDGTDGFIIGQFFTAGCADKTELNRGNRVDDAGAFGGGKGSELEETTMIIDLRRIGGVVDRNNS